MIFDVQCAHCHAQLEIEVDFEPNETLADDEPEDVRLECPKCGGAVEMTLDSGAESVDIRVRSG